jgi:ABC-type branched-subunit amino acid transport system permease subunit
MARSAILLLRLLCLAVVLVAPFALNPYWTLLVLQSVLSAYLALSFDIAYSYGRVLSFCQGLFFAIAAYVAVYLATPAGWSLPAMLAGGILAGAVASLLVGLLVLRIQGHGAIIATVILAAAGLLLGNALSDYTGGDDGIALTVAHVGALAWQVSPGVNMATYYLAALPLVAIVLALWRAQGTLGWTVLRALAMNDVRARQIGFDVGRQRLGLFVVSGAVAGFSGALYALVMSHVTTASLEIGLSVNAILWAVVGGLGSSFGALLGALIILPLTEFVASVFVYVQVFVGLLLVLVALLLPKGVVGTLMEIAARTTAERG